MFELGARPHPPRALYRAYLEQSHIFIGIYWQSYGWVAPDMDISGIEDEYELSAGKPCLVYMKEPAAERQPLLEKLFDRVKSENRVSFKRFKTAEELGDLVANDLALLLTEQLPGGPGADHLDRGRLATAPASVAGAAHGSRRPRARGAAGVLVDAAGRRTTADAVRCGRYRKDPTGARGGR